MYVRCKSGVTFVRRFFRDVFICAKYVPPNSFLLFHARINHFDKEMFDVSLTYMVCNM